MKKFLLSLTCVAAMASSFAQDCTNLFISEYVEGHGNNKALEIYNPSSEPINMGEYFLQRYNNGSTDAPAQGVTDARTMQLPNVMLAPYSTYVIVLDRTAANASVDDPAVWSELYALRDTAMCSAYEINNTMNFNGNDALVLAKGDATAPVLNNIMDLFGKIGEDPKNAGRGTNGWTSVSPFNATSPDPLDKVVTENHSMIRKPSIKKGNIPTGSFLFKTWDPLAEWDSIPASIPKTDPVTGEIVYQQNGVTPQWVGNWSTLGWHYCECNPLSTEMINMDNLKVFPNPSTGVVSLSGLVNVVSIEVFNSLGQVVYTQNQNIKETVSFDLSGKAGLYLISIKDNSGRTATQKVIIK